MSIPTPSCPEHDAIADLIRSAQANLTDVQAESDDSPKTYRAAAITSLLSRIEVLFTALAAVDGVRYTVTQIPESKSAPWFTWDRWHAADELPAFPTHDAAQADVEQRNAVNVAARAQDLQDELDGIVR